MKTFMRLAFVSLLAVSTVAYAHDGGKAHKGKAKQQTSCCNSSCNSSQCPPHCDKGSCPKKS